MFLQIFPVPGLPHVLDIIQIETHDAAQWIWVNPQI